MQLVQGLTHEYIYIYIYIYTYIYIYIHSWRFCVVTSHFLVTAKNTTGPGWSSVATAGTNMG